jgi:hypothetical protein
MERLSLMRIQHISPHRIRATEWIRVNVVAEAIAAGEHNVHRLSASRDPKAGRRPSIDAISDTLFLFSELNLDIESPESHAMLGMQSKPSDFSVFPSLFAVVVWFFACRIPVGGAVEGTSGHLKEPIVRLFSGQVLHFWQMVLGRGVSS